jgi:hypothetical protein
MSKAEHWRWNPLEPAEVCERLDSYMKLRGDVVHRSRPQGNGPPSAHPATKSGLERAIGFLKRLVEATDKALAAASRA